MSQLDTKLAQTVELLRRYRQTLRSMLLTQDRNQQKLLLEFSGGLDLLHIIVQLMVVSSDNVAHSILQECSDLDPEHFRLGFWNIYEGLRGLRRQVEPFIRPQAAFAAIVERLKKDFRPHRPRGSLWWLEDRTTSISAVWSNAYTVPVTEDLDKRRFILLYKISLRASEFVNAPPADFVDAFRSLQDYVDRHSQRSLEHRTIPTFGYRKDVIYNA